ncbi:hypothetical protein BS47DRAFT_1397895 [Hydnum rufescens UP504]|uniref:Uncharacterized protein n=1 Tax=Hydnum rufescens UP504 TaxID=1448309 RepID=A0A9P6DMV2_9AGAM|nr:hypothetical protein BS47DRAFT_1397895 [Hydnum rufescens UP504]
MMPIIESVEPGDPGDSRNITDQAETSALVKQEPWVIDSLPNGPVTLAGSGSNTPSSTPSSEPHPSGMNPTLCHRDGSVEANNVIEESLAFKVTPPGEGSDVLQASKRGSTYATPAPTPRPRGNTSSASASVDRPRRRRGTRLQVVPVTPTSIPTRSRSPSSPPIFADLDPAIARALRKMCRKFSFTPEEVRQKWDINRGDLLATFLVIRKNREFLDQTDMFADN